MLDFQDSEAVVDCANGGVIKMYLLFDQLFTAFWVNKKQKKTR